LQKTSRLPLDDAAGHLIADGVGEKQWDQRENEEPGEDAPTQPAGSREDRS
jgi:hypothetical protein